MSVVLVSGVTVLYNNVFSRCTSLTSIEIPNSVTSIWYEAFSGCESLTIIVFNGTATQWSEIEKDEGWYTRIPATYVQCYDGQVAL